MILINIIECCAKLFSLELIDIIPQLMHNIKPLIMNEIIADMYYFYLSSFNEKIEKYMIEINNDESKLKLSVDDFCVIGRKKCHN